MTPLSLPQHRVAAPNGAIELFAVPLQAPIGIRLQICLAVGQQRSTITRKRMRYVVILFAAALATVASTSGDAQAARIGRLPVLGLPFPGGGSCRDESVTAALQRDGVTRLISFQSSDSSGHRLISLGMSAKGGSVMLMAMMGTDQGRRGEAESVNVFFGTDGAITRGRRSAFTSGTPARLSDDRQSGLQPADTLAVRRLDAALRRRCGG
jgi:hypothetical protein